MNTDHLSEATVVAINPDIEEEVVLAIDGLALVCFVTACPYAIEIGKSYPVALRLWAADGLVLTATERPSSIARIGHSFAYSITGIMRGSSIDVGITLQADGIDHEYAFMDGGRVSTQADRISAWFD